MAEMKRPQGELIPDKSKDHSSDSCYVPVKALHSIHKSRGSSTCQSDKHPDFPSVKGRRRVAFGVVLLHYHPIALGDNPGVTSGPPLTIDWTAIHSHQVTVDTFEKSKSCTNGRRKGTLLKLSRVDRINLLSVQGYSRQEMNRAEREVNMIKASRKASRQHYLGSTVSYRIGILKDAESRLFWTPHLEETQTKAKKTDVDDSILPAVVRFIMAKAA